MGVLMKTHGVLAAAAFLALAGAACAQIAVSANDGKQLRPGDNPPGMRPDTVATIDLNVYPPKMLAKIDAPASMIGPPRAVAVSPDSRFAIVTCAQKPDPSDPAKVVLADTVSVIDISNPRKPHVVQTAAAGDGASGVSMNAGATMALVANTSGSISVFTISHERLTKVGTVDLEPDSGPTDVVFSRNGKHAYAVERGGNRIDVLDVNGTTVTNSGKSFVTGIGPDGMSITPDGKFGIDTNLQGAATPEALQRVKEMQAMRARMAQERAAGGAPRRPGGPGGPGARPRRRFTPTPGTLALFNLETGKVVDSVVVGDTPEHVDLSPDGKYAEVTVANGAASSMTAPNYSTTHGLIWVFGVNDGKLTEIAKTDTGHWCQGATWSKDDHMILLQCATERDIEVYKFDGKTLTQDPSATLHFNARPGSISTATNQ
jgi:DNA-binding beta-propeller fold protein YncE